MHINRPTMFFVQLLLISSLVLSAFGCDIIPDELIPDITSPDGDSSGPVGETAELIMDISQSDSDEEREEAVKEIVSRGHSLGLLDEDGVQLNPHVPEDAISLTPDDIAAMSAFVEIGHFRTIGSVVDYLAEAGVVLGSTGEVITFEDLLPDLQKYVNWSFANPDDPDNQLGLLLASGPELITPDSAPVIEATTQISPMAAILMLGDILIGVEEFNSAEVTGNWFTDVAYADDLQETAKRIQGYITKIETFAKPAQATLNFFRKGSEILGFSEPSKEPPKEIKIPEIAKQLIAAFAMGNHFAVRIKDPVTASVENMPIVKSIDLAQVGDSEKLFLSVELIAPKGSQGSNKKIDITDDIPVMYTLRLLSPNETGYGAPLYPDADAILSPSGLIATTGANGHIMDIAGKGIEIPAIFVIEATKLDNKEKRIAILHASATILTGDLEKQYAKYTKEYAGAIKGILGLKPEQIQEMFSVMKTAVTVSPWMVEVILTGGREVTLDPEELKGEPNQPYKFTARIDDVPAGSYWEWSVVRNRASGDVEKVDFKSGPDNVITLAFPEDGNYTVEAVLWDSKGGSAKVIDSAQAEVVIQGKKEANIEISIEPKDTIGETGCGMGFKVVPNVPWEELPEKIIWQWNFDDGTEVVEKEASPHNGGYRNEEYHNYTWPATYDITVKMLDGASKDVIAKAEIAYEINNLNAIQRTTHVRALFWAFKNVPTYEDLGGTLTKRNDFKTHSSIGLSASGAPPLKWTDNRFFVSWSSTVDTQSYVWTIDGTVSHDEVEEVTLTSEFIDTSYQGKLWTRKEVVVLRNIPIEKRNCGDSVRFYKYLTGEVPTGYPLADMVSFEYESRIVGEYGEKGDRLDKFEGFDYTEQKPAVEVEFWIEK